MGSQFTQRCRYYAKVICVQQSSSDTVKMVGLCGTTFSLAIYLISDQ